MFLERVQSYIKGYVDFQARGGFPERFINLCSANFLNIYNVKMYRETITASCDIKSYLKIRSVAKKSGMKVRMIKKHGLPFWIHRKRNRIGIVAGFVFFIIITYFLSGHIWTVNVNGNENVPSEDIIEAFSLLGVKPGMKKDSINTKDTALRALTEIDSLMWTAINIDGCKITIEVKERVEKNTQPEDETPQNIVASKSGQVILIEDFLGTPVLEVGSAVEKGDIVVSGAVINRDETVSFYKADANVYARTKNTVEVFQNVSAQMRVYKKVRKQHFLSFFTLNIPLSFSRKTAGDYDFSSGEDFLSSGDGKLPLGIITHRNAFYDVEKVKLTQQAVRLMCLEKYLREIDENFGEIKIEKMTTHTEKMKNGYMISTVFECVENIAESRVMDMKIESENNNAF